MMGMMKTFAKAMATTALIVGGSSAMAADIVVIGGMNSDQF